MDRFAAWVERYRKAWDSNEPGDISALFSEDAAYLPKPSAAAWQGQDEIVSKWIEYKDQPGDAEFEYEVAARAGDTGFIRGVTVYRAARKTYDNLWEVTLDDYDRCTRFVEWWIEREG